MDNKINTQKRNQMFSNQAAVVSLNFPARCLDSIKGSKTDSRFVVGSASIHETNELVVLRLHSELNELGIDARLDHPTGPVGALATSPSDKTLILTATERSYSVNLWRAPTEAVDRMDDLEYSPEGDVGAVESPAPVEQELEQVATFNHDIESQVESIVWRETSFEDAGVPGEMVSMDRQGKLTQWDITTAQAVRSDTVSKANELSPSRVAWDPHNASAVCATAGSCVEIRDWRADTSMPQGTVSSIRAHKHGVVDIDYNPNKPHVLASAGVDSLLKFWDLRSQRRPLLSARGGHAHYAWNVQYNPFHDQLVLSSGTDSAVNLWRVSTISSAPLLTIDDEANQEKSETSAANVRVARYEHADSVYGMAWSSADAWVYATLAYDGKVALNHVPSKEKYKILL